MQLEFIFVKTETGGITTKIGFVDYAGGVDISELFAAHEKIVEQEFQPNTMIMHPDTYSLIEKAYSDAD